MIRLLLSDVMKRRLKSKFAILGVYQTDNLFDCIEGVLWRVRTGCPWRDLPDFFGPWKTIYNRFNEWSKAEIWNSLFVTVKTEIDTEWIFIDGTYVKAHQHCSGGKEEKEEKTIGLSRGGLTTKIHMVADSHGNPTSFKITSGSVHDSTVATCLLDEVADPENVIGDKGYDSEAIRAFIIRKGAVPHIPLRKRSKRSNPSFDAELYSHRHLIENLFARLKHFRGFATRFDKLTRNFASVVAISCMMIWLKL